MELRKTKKEINANDDLILWNSLKKGDEKAFSLLFEKYYPELVRYGNNLSSSTDKVQDAVQDVFTDIWVYRKSLNDALIVKAYLLSSVRKRMARLQERDHIFKQPKNIDCLEFLLEFSVEHHLIDDETTADTILQLNKHINNLPSRQKEALYLRYHQNLNIDQIAEILEVNYQSATNLVYRAIVNIKKEWTESAAILLVFMQII